MGLDSNRSVCRKKCNKQLCLIKNKIYYKSFELIRGIKKYKFIEIYHIRIGIY